MALVSIIIPTYNSIKYIEETINSLLLQTYKQIEIIVIDDGSSDGTINLVKKFEEQGIVCLQQPNNGASVARNMGLSAAKGEYIQFLDSDDLLYPSKIEEQIALLNKHDADISFSLWSSFETDLTYKKDYNYTHDLTKIRSGKETIKSFGLDNWFVPVHCWLTKKTLIQKAGYWNPNISNNDDGEYFSRILFWAEKVVCNPKHHAFYRTANQTSLSKINSIDKIHSAINSWQLIQSLVSTFNESTYLVYPQKAYYILYLETKDIFPKESRRIAYEFDKINKMIKYPHIRQFPIYSSLINILGLAKGVRIYKFIQLSRKFFSKK